jgi:hypothetical protein
MIPEDFPPTYQYLSFSGGVVSQKVYWHTGFVVPNNYHTTHRKELIMFTACTNAVLKSLDQVGIKPLFVDKTDNTMLVMVDDLTQISVTGYTHQTDVTITNTNDDYLKVNCLGAFIVCDDKQLQDLTDFLSNL